MTKRIDTHAHLGECCVFGLLSTEEDMLRRMEECNVDATIVQPYPGATLGFTNTRPHCQFVRQASGPLLRPGQRNPAWQP